MQKEFVSILLSAEAPTEAEELSTMQLKLCMVVPLECRDVPEASHVRSLVYTWLVKQRDEGEWSPVELHLQFGWRVIHARPILPEQLVEQWPELILTAEEELSGDTAEQLAEKTMESLASFLQRELRLEVPATITVGERSYPYHYSSIR